MNASDRTITRWGARATTSLAAVAIAAAALPGSAQAAEAVAPSVEGGAAAVQSGSTVRISFPAYRLAAGERTNSRTVHATVVFRASDCGTGASRPPGGRDVAVPFGELNDTFTLDFPIPTRGDVPQIDSYYLCAYELGQVGPTVVNVDGPRTTWRIQPGTNAQVNPALPGTPAIIGGTTATGVPAGGAIQVSAGLISFGPPGETVTQRSIRRSVVAAPGVDSCAGGSGVRELDVLSFGLGNVTANLVVNGSAGQYLCIDQLLATTTDPRVRTSPPIVTLITGHTPTGPSAGAILGVNAAIARVQAATANLVDLNLRGNATPAQTAAAIQEAQEAQEALQGAQAAAAAAGADPADSANGNGADAVVPADAGGAAAADALDTLRQQLGTTVADTPVRVSPQSNPTLLALAAATGFDPLATPILAEGQSNIAGVSLSVTKPKKIKRGKGFKATLKVAPVSTRGGMRQYLLRMDGDQPTLVHKRSGFITKGSRSKKYWISPKAPKGTYALLSTFQPSTPGVAGTAILTPLTVK